MHAVFSPENCIFDGGHFYATSTMKDTMFGIVHSFIRHFQHRQVFPWTSFEADSNIKLQSSGIEGSAR